MTEIRPLSSPQAAIWWDGAGNPQGTAYNVAERLRLRGELRPDLLFQAIARVDAAADGLRLRFTQTGGQPGQFVDPQPKRDFALVDLSHADDPEQAALAEAEQAVARPYDLGVGPLHRHRLYRLAPDHHIWLRAFHHLVWDGYSATVELRHVARTYAALCQGQAPPELELGSYLDFLDDEAAYAGSQARKDDLAYWRQALAQGCPLTGFSESPPEPGRGSAHRLSRGLEAEMVAGLVAAARAMGSTLANLLLAAYLLALGRAARSDRPGCAVAMLNRYAASQRAAIGAFAQVAPVGLDLSQGHGFDELVRQVSVLQRAHRRHGRLSLAMSAQEGIDPWQGGTPWGAAFNALDFPYDLGFPGLTVAPEIFAVGPVHDIHLAVCAQQRRTGGGEVNLLWFYNPARHTPQGMARLAARYQALLAAILAAPQAAPSALTMLPAEEEQAIAAWETGPPAPAGCGDVPAHLAFWRRAQAAPKAPAVFAAGRGLDYAGLAQRAAALARLLREAGVGAETPVGLCLGPTPELVVGYLGILAAGGAVLPLEPTLPPARLGEMALGLDCSLVLVQGPSRDRLPAELTRQARVIDLDQLPAATDPGEFIPAGAAPEQLACIFHTSGSTGSPKPVGVTHGALAAKMATMTPYFDIVAGEVFCAAASLAFDPLLQQLFLPLTTGGKIWLPGATLLVDPPAFWPQAAAQGVTHLNLVPSMLDALLEGAPPRPLPSIRRLVVGGERLAPELAARTAAILGVEAFWNMYGPTETTVDATGWRVDPALSEEIPIGRPLTGYAVRLLDQDLRRVPVGQAGELCIGGMGLARGYLGRPEQTRERFVPDPYGPPGARLYRSGDYARWREDGAVVFLGRRDDQIKIRGQRIELGEVEAALRRQPQVSQAAVVFSKDDAGGSLTAYVVGQTSPRELAAALAGELPRAAVPGRFVFLDALPFLPSGKVDRLALPAAAASPASRPAAPAAPPAFAFPAASGGGALRRAMAAVWAELLGRTEIDPQANLFEMGAHSLLVPRAVARISALAGRPVSATDLFQYPSVNALAAHLSGAPAGRPASVEPRPLAQAAGERAVAIIGMALRLPGAADRATFWANLRQGVCSVSSPKARELLAAGASPSLVQDPAFRPQQGRLEGMELFDPAPFAYTPGEAAEMDPQQRLLLETAWQALEDAGCDPETDGPVGAVAGVGFNAYLLDNLGPRLAQGSLTDRYMLMLGNDKDHAATRLGYKLGLTGPVLNLNTACSTGLAAVAEAVEHLRAGRARAMLAGGASLGMTTHGGYLYAEGGIASVSGVCRPFDAEADGTVPGSGVGMVVLKRLDEALADGDTIHAVIRGVGVNNDGSARAAFTAPSVRGQATALAAALADAGVKPASLGFVEGHGTGTALGDPIELQALGLAYGGGEAPPPTGGILLGSLKGNLGHLDAAAGVAGLIKAVLALGAGEVPPTCHLRQPNPRIDWASSPFRVNAQVEPWPPRPAGQPRRAAVSSFGVGGTNVHVVLEQAPERRPAARPDNPGPVLLALSAADPQALEELASSLASSLAQHSLSEAAATLASRRRLRHRLAVVASDQAEAAQRLAQRPAQPQAPGRVRGLCPVGGASPALVFPGQGSQHPGMGRDLYHGQPLFRQVVDEACDLLAGGAAAGLRELILADPGDQAAAARLAHTAVTQPALFTVEYGVARLLMHHGLAPEALAGHSVGEYVAACLAGVMDFPAALALVAERGRLMGSAPSGAMLALALAEDEARTLVEACGPGVSLAVVNGPRQCVAAGEEAAVAELEARVKALGRPARRLAVSHAFHCHLMDGILEPFRLAVARVDLRPPRIPLASNLNGGWLTAAEAMDPDYWVRHLRGQVRFAANLALLLAEPDRVLVEAGPGQTLTRLAQANGAEPARALATQPQPASLDGCSSLLLALSGLWLRGWEPDWAALTNGLPRARVPLPTYPFQRRRLWIDPVAPAPARAERETGGLDDAPPAQASAPADQPQTLAQALTAVWQEVFGLPGLGPADDFLTLGGDSLLAVRLVARIKERLGRPVAVAAIFECRTAEALARALASGLAATPPAPAREEGVL